MAAAREQIRVVKTADRNTNSFYFIRNLIQVMEEDGRVRIVVVGQKKHTGMSTLQRIKSVRYSG